MFWQSMMQHVISSIIDDNHACSNFENNNGDIASKSDFKPVDLFTAASKIL